MGRALPLRVISAKSQGCQLFFRSLAGKVMQGFVVQAAGPQTFHHHEQPSVTSRSSPSDNALVMADKRKTRHAGDNAIDAEHHNSRKRPRSSIDYVEGERKPSKAAHSQQGRVDPTYGQRSALPGLDAYSIEHNGDTENGTINHSSDEAHALNYLRAVRKEAAGIPNLLVAPRAPATADSDEPDRSIYTDGLGDSRGYYRDGAYTAAPILSTDNDLPTTGRSSDGGDPQVACYRSILRHFDGLRRKLRRRVPADAVRRLDAAHTHVVQRSLSSSTEWLWRLKHTDPLPAQLALMGKGGKLRLLRALGAGKGGMLRRGRHVGSRTGAWLWGLLAGLPDGGELGSEEVSVVRDLGKLAVKMSLGVRDGRLLEEAMEEEDADVVDADDADTDVEDGYADDAAENMDDEGALEEHDEDEITKDDGQGLDLDGTEDAEQSAGLSEPPSAAGLVTAKERFLANLEIPSQPEDQSQTNAAAEPVELKADQVVIENGSNEDLGSESMTRATIDMILTVAGEVYGQKDLLEFRRKWD